eukprot:Hpha_TRINITY_DN747_c0_g1::TRINITY_DN747_c0_g1_i1::g.28985::m.28985
MALVRPRGDSWAVGVEVTLEPPPLPLGTIASTQPTQDFSRYLPGDDVLVRDKLRAGDDETEWLPGKVVDTHPVTVAPEAWDKAFEWDEIKEAQPGLFASLPPDPRGPHSELLSIRQRSTARAAKGATVLGIAQLHNNERAQRAAIENSFKPSWVELERRLDARLVEARDWLNDPPLQHTTKVLREQLTYWQSTMAAMAPPPPPPPKSNMLDDIRAELAAEEAEEEARLAKLRHKEQQHSAAVHRRRSSMRMLAEKGSMRRR